jgi:hypothetical protein
LVPNIGYKSTVLSSGGVASTVFMMIRYFAKDTAVLATDSNPGIASQKLQTISDAIQKWLKRWKIKANESKSVHVTFTTQRGNCSPVHINSVHLPQQEDVKYLG